VGPPAAARQLQRPEVALQLLTRELAARPRQSAAQLALCLGIRRELAEQVLRESEQFSHNEHELWVLAEQVRQLPDLEPFELSFTPRPPRLRPWQLAALRAWGGNQRRGVVCAVTGTGKTMLGIHAVCRVLQEGGRALVLVPSVDLVGQWTRQLQQWLPGVPVGDLGRQGGLRRHPVVVSTIQAAIRRPELAPPGVPSLLVCDEVHYMGAGQFGRALDPGFQQRLGLTATWVRTDGAHRRVLEPYFGPVMYTLDYRGAAQEQVIAPFDVWLVGVRFSASEAERYSWLHQQLQDTRDVLVNRYGAPRDWGRLSQLLPVWAGQQHSNPARCRLARSYLKMFNQRRETLAGAQAKLEALGALAPTIAAASRALVFCQTVESARVAAQALADRRVDARAYVGGMGAAARRLLLQGFHDGSPQCLCAPRVLDEGIDVPAADLGVIVAASMSERQMIQRMGRILRPKSDGRSARFLILYVQGTMEDPQLGAHDGFLQQVLEVAQQVRFLPADQLPTDGPLQ